MRTILTITSLLCLIAVISVKAQNVGIGVSSPGQKLHIGGNTNTLRIDGLSSTLGGSFIANPTLNTHKLTFVDANGDLWSMPNGTSGQVLSISAAGVPTWTTAVTTDWTLTGNLGTNPNINYLGTNDNQDFVLRTNANERLRVAASGTVGINVAPSATHQLAVSSALTAGNTIYGANTSTSGTAVLGQITGTAGAGTAIAINGITNQSGGFGVRGENNQATGRAVLGFNTAASGTSSGGAGVLGQIAQGATATTVGGYGVGGINTHAQGFGMYAVGNNLLTVTFTTVGAGLLSNGTLRGIFSAANTAPGTGQTSFGVQGYIGVGTSGTGYGAGVRGDAVSTTGLVDGMSGVTASSGGVGIFGATGSTANTSFGILGIHSGHSGGTGIVGVGNALTTYSYFTSGSGGTFNSSNLGVSGIGTTNTSTGAYGINNAASGTSTGTGVWGVTSQSQGNGVYGAQNNSITNAAHFGPAVLGFNLAATGTGYGDGVSGLTAQLNGFAFYGVNTNNTSSTSGGTGVFATGNNQGGWYLVGGSGGAFTGRTVGVYGRVGQDSTVATGTVSGGFFYANVNAYAYVGARSGGTNYKIIGTGAVSTIVRDQNNQYRVMAAPEAPEILFMDFGTGQLVNGKAYVALDPIFTKNIHVDANHPLRVFIQLEGDCNGVYVTNKTANGFEVVELAGGNSNVPFSWQVVANRADELNPDGTVASHYANFRFNPAPELPATASGRDPNQIWNATLQRSQPAMVTMPKEHLLIRLQPQNNISTAKVEKVE